MKSERKLPIRLQLDPDEIDYLSATPPEGISFDSLHARLFIVADWTLDAKSSHYRPSDEELTIDNVQVSVMLEEFVTAAQRLDEGTELVPRVVIHGTPMEFAIARSGDVVSLELIEAIDYSDEERLLGSLRTTLAGLRALVAELGLQFVSQLSAANPSLESDPGLLNFKHHLESLRRRA